MLVVCGVWVLVTFGPGTPLLNDGPGTEGQEWYVTALMVYFPLILIFARRWQKDFGLGSLTAIMIPYSLWMLITGVILMVLWIAFGINLGPGAPMGIELQGAG